MLVFFKAHSFSIFCILGLIWIAEVVLTQFRYKNKGVLLEGTIIAHKNQNGYVFPVYEFEYMGEKLHVDSYNSTKNPATIGQTEMIYYFPGNTKGVFSEKHIGVKPWQIICFVAALAYIILDFTILHK